MENQNAILVDIDGTYALGIGEHRKAFEYHKCGHDKQNKTVKMVMVAMIRSHYIDKIIFLSGRENVTFPGKSTRKDKSYRRALWSGNEHKDCYDLTYHWIDHWLSCADIEDDQWELFMREADDNRKDSIIKEEIYNKVIKPRYNIKLVLDDRNQVVDMWRNIGLPCFQVAPGDF